MKKQNLFENLFLGTKNKKLLIATYAVILTGFLLYFLGKACGKAIFYLYHS